MLKTNVKASSVTNLTDARYFAAWEVAWLGFNFDAGSDRYIQPQLMKAIREWVDGVKAVGEFNMQAPEEIRAAAELLALDAVQVGMFTDLSALDSLGLGVPSLEAVANSDAYLKQETAPINHQLFLDTMSYANVKPCFRGYDEWATLIGDGMFSVWLGEAELEPTLSELVPQADAVLAEAAD